MLMVGVHIHTATQESICGTLSSQWCMYPMALKSYFKKNSSAVHKSTV